MEMSALGGFVFRTSLAFAFDGYESPSPSCYVAL